MPRDFLHNHPQFADLIRIVGDYKGIALALGEKDYWRSTDVIPSIVMVCVNRS